MEYLKIKFAETGVIVDNTNAIVHHLNTSLNESKQVRLMIECIDTFKSSDTEIFPSGPTSHMWELALDSAGSPGIFSGGTLSVGLIEDSPAYFWAKALSLDTEDVMNDVSTILRTSGLIQPGEFSLLKIIDYQQITLVDNIEPSTVTYDNGQFTVPYYISEFSFTDYGITWVFKYENGNWNLYEYIMYPFMWEDDMIISYKALNPEQAEWMEGTVHGQSAEAELYERLKPNTYLNNTFGPNGQNKTECDFLLLFMSLAENTIEQGSAKTGTVLRWNIKGTIFNQTNIPTHTINNYGIITVSSTDGWPGVEEFRVNSNGLIGRPCRFNGFSGLSMFRISENQLTGNLPVWGFGELDSYSIGNNLFTGTLPNTHITNAYGVWAFNNLFSAVGAVAPKGIMHEGYFRLDGNNITSFEALLAAIYDNRFEVSYHSPGLNISGGNNAEPLPVGKSPQQAYTDGDTGTGKWYMHVLGTNPLNQDFNTWTFVPDYEVQEEELTIEVKDGSDNPIEGVEIEIN